MKPSTRPDTKRLNGFMAALLVFAALRVAVGYIAVPTALVPAASVVTTILFMVLPFAALFLGAGHRWDLKQALAVVLLGVAIQYGGTHLARMAATPGGAGLIFAGSQAGLVVWCMGAGAALACLLKDRNMLLPIAVFLALFDMWLVFAPEGLVSRALTGSRAPLKLEQVALAVPKVATAEAPKEANGFAQNLAYVGPADLLFLAMFFVALYRFAMRPRATLYAIAPVLVAYLAVVLLFPTAGFGPIHFGALPALLPIGLTVLWVNRREFKLLPDERIITIGMLVIGIPFVAWRIIATQEPERPARSAPLSPPGERGRG